MDTLDRSKWHNRVMHICEGQDSKVRDYAYQNKISYDEALEEFEKDKDFVEDTYLYIKLDGKLAAPITLYPGETLRMKSKQDALDETLEAGAIDEKQHADMSEKMAFMKYEVTVPPLKDE